MSAIYIDLKVKGTKSFINLWYDPAIKEIGGIVYKCGTNKESEELDGFTVKDSSGHEIVKITGHGINRTNYTDFTLFISVFDTNGVKRKLFLFDPEEEIKFRPPVIMEA